MSGNVHADDPDAEPQLDVVAVVELGFAHVVRFVGVTEQHLLGQRRKLVRQVPLATEDDEVAGISPLAQCTRRAGAGQTRADYHDPLRFSHFSHPFR